MKGDAMSTKLGKANGPIVFDSIYGQTFNDRRLLALAVSYGFVLPDGYEKCIAYDYETAEFKPFAFDPDTVSFVLDDALNYINANAVEPGYYVDWHNGDLLVLTLEQWEDMD